MDKVLTLVRGVSGSGKSSFAEAMANEEYPWPVFSADNYLYEDGVYKWEGWKLPKVHAQCLEETKKAMKTGVEKIFVANTFAAEKELTPYINSAKFHGYKVFVVIVENRHGGESVHNVPEHSLEVQKQRILNTIKL